MASTTTQTLMTSKSVLTALAPAQLQTNRLPDECVLIYTDPLKSVPEPLRKLLDAACVLGCLRVLKDPKGNTRKFTFPSRHVLSVLSDPGQFVITQGTHSCPHPSHLTTNPTPRHPLFLLSSISFAMTLIASGIGNVSHHLIHFPSAARHLPREMLGFTKHHILSFHALLVRRALMLLGSEADLHSQAIHHLYFNLRFPCLSQNKEKIFPLSPLSLLLLFKVFEQNIAFKSAHTHCILRT